MENTISFSIAMDARSTLLGGQTFAFDQACASPTECSERDGRESYAGVADGRPVFVEQATATHSTVTCLAHDAAYFARYFFEGTDWAAELAPIAASEPRLAACLAAFPGLRPLRQPAWEALCMFILSANNNLGRIGKTYRSLAAKLGEPAAELAVGDAKQVLVITAKDGSALKAFPSPETLAAAGEPPLREAGAGYRAPYLAKTARMAADGFSLDFDSMEYDDARKHLMECPGVGEKVADCVLLASSRHTQALPVDVWVARALEARFGMTGSRRDIKLRAQERLGRLAGIAQLFLFHGERMGLA